MKRDLQSYLDEAGAILRTAYLYPGKSMETTIAIINTLVSLRMAMESASATQDKGEHEKNLFD